MQCWTSSRAVTANDAVQLVGFGSFSMGQRAARTGRNPSTGVEIRIAAAKAVKVTAGKAFKDAERVTTKPVIAPGDCAGLHEELISVVE